MFYITSIVATAVKVLHLAQSVRVKQFPALHLGAAVSTELKTM